LEHLPEAIAHLSNLSELYVSDNFLMDLPRMLKQLPRLVMLNLTDNPLPIPSEILERIYEPSAILRHAAA
jgi:hypothetical protein